MQKSEHSFSFRRFSFKRTEVLGLAVSLLVLAPCLYYGYLYLVPDVGLSLNVETWEVRSVFGCESPEECLQAGDRVLAIGDVTLEEYSSSRTKKLYAAFETADVVPVRVLREGREKTILVRERKGLTSFWNLYTASALFPLVFWAMGTLAVLFLRPRDQRWWLLVLFYYVTALWFASGLVSSRQAGYAAIVFHTVIWLWIPLVVHLHLILPRPLLAAWPTRLLLAPLYALSLVMMAADLLQLVGGKIYLGFFMASVLVALGLLLSRFFLRLPAAAVVANRIMVFGVALGFAPLLLFYILPVILPQTDLPDSQAHPFYPWAAIVPLIAIPIWPLSYIYAVYKHHLGTLELRANRLLGVYSFYSLYVTGYVVVLLLASGYGALIDGRSVAITLAVSMAFVSGAPLVRRPFQVLVDRFIFGIKHSPEEVIGLVAERIPRAFDREVLARTIVDEILPTLLIRQSALYLFENGRGETLYTQSLPPQAWEPDAASLHHLAARAGRFLPAREERSDAFAWVRLVVPLAIQEETIGLWLIGRRDPDDYFPREDIDLLWTLANQIAPVVENIRLYERAQQEIAQRRAAEQEIRQSEQRFRNLFEATLEGIAIVRGGVILEVNHALLEIFEHPPAEIIGRPLSEIITSGEVRPGGGPREGIGRKRDGTTVDVELAVKSSIFQGEDVTVVAVRDITRRKRDEAENKMLQQQLLQSQKMEAIGRLSAGVAHDFNNCLLAIFGYSDLLLSQAGEDELLRRNLLGIKEAGQKAAALTKQLLAFTRQQPMEARVMDLNQVVSDLEEMLQRLIGEDIRLSTRLTEPLPPVKIDPGQMEQVIMNLVVNARDAMPDGGDLTLATGLGRVDGVGTPHVQRAEGSYVVLTVQDTGVGMDPETRNRVFEPFFSTKKIGEGTGLGLSTAYGIVKQSRGFIFVDSSPGMGATFSIYLPPAAEEAAAEEPEPGDLPDAGSETVLLVEDEDEARVVLRQILTAQGYRVLEAASGREALALAGRHDGAIHLLLTDLTMPGMRGTELAEHLLRERPSARVLYMSGYNEEPIDHDRVSGIAPVYLQKPFPAETLTRRVREVLDGRA